jgi:hypothetical protein
MTQDRIERRQRLHDNVLVANELLQEDLFLTLLTMMTDKQVVAFTSGFILRVESNLLKLGETP